jgi:O-antigen/teichoic acid export membrane protein
VSIPDSRLIGPQRRSKLFRHAGSWKFIKNAVSNLISGGASAILAVALPYYFVRDFRPTEFSLWILVLQVAAYVNFFNFGVQVAIGRYVSYAVGCGSKSDAEDILAGGIQLLATLAAAAFCLIAVVSLFLPVIFPTIDRPLIGTARSMLLWIGGALAVGLPFTAFLGVFVGIQRNEIPAIISLLSKSLLAVVLITTALFTHDLKATARAYFIASIGGYCLHFLFFRIICPEWRIRLASQNSSRRRELISYCLSLTVWSFAMLLVTGLDTTVVGIFDFKDVAAYGVSANIVAVFIGLFRSILSPMLQVFTKLHARKSDDALLRLFHLASSLATLSLLCVACWMTVLAGPLFHYWVGAGIAKVGVPIFIVLIFANTIRNSAAPYANYLLAVGLQRKVYLSPFAEGVTNLAASVCLAVAIGAIGVAWGTVIGSIVGVGANFFYNMRRTMPSQFSIGEHFLANLAGPILVSLPMLTVLYFSLAGHWSFLSSVLLMLIASIPCAVTAWRSYRPIAKDLFGSGVSSDSDFLPSSPL